MNKFILAVASIGFFLLAVVWADESESAAKRVRVGVYDSRAIAIAYAASEYNPVRGKVKELEQAKAAGDAKRVAELEEWGQRHQRALHRQGFSRVPVGDLLAHVRDQLPLVAQEERLDVVVSECDYVAPHAEVIDVTSALVRLYKPSKQTLRHVEEIQKRPPVDLDEIDRHTDH